MVGCGCSRVVPQVSIFPSQSVAILAWPTYDIHRCDANPKNLDADGANPRWQGKTNFLINTWDPGILWSDFGVRSDVLVLFFFVSTTHCPHIHPLEAIHSRLPPG